MLKPIVLVGAVLTFGCFTPAHAGHYELQPNNWMVVTSSAPALTSAGTFNNPVRQSPLPVFGQTSFQWNWVGNGTARPLKITLAYDTTLGACFVETDVPGNLASSEVEGGFVSRYAAADTMDADGFGDSGFHRLNYSTIGSAPGSNPPASPFSLRNGAEFIGDQVDVKAITTANSYGGTVTAGSTNGHLTAPPTYVVQ